MKRSYTEGELIELWRVKRGLLPSLQIKEQSQYTPLEQRLALEIREWYSDKLLRGEERFLPVEDIKEECECRYISDNCLEVRFPSRAVRFVELKLPEWSLPIRCLEKPCGEKAHLQWYPLARGSVKNPVVVDFWPVVRAYGVNSQRKDFTPGGDSASDSNEANAVAISGSETPEVEEFEKPKVERILAVVQPEAGIYTIDDVLLHSEILKIGAALKL